MSKTASKSSKPAAAKSPAAKPAAKEPTKAPAAPVAPVVKEAAAKEPKKEPAKSTKRAGQKPEGEPRASVIPNEAKLEVLSKENPKRGENARRIFDLYAKCKTVGEWREAMKKEELDQGYLHGDLRRGLIKVVLPTLREQAKAETKAPAATEPKPSKAPAKAAKPAAK